ncbi:Putative AAA+ ATPase domain, origin recognition complex subunit 4, orc1-like, AAA ATPase [Septoria linicola]|uniref:Origin recognition complex subunit 4 n=1 Tax=Septoria linicola TaxID=215465 RepID=A0A9Q9AY68_9PEZI|nr:putative AAA+ ATPase domain, origin recognition complex subunit 4, orc1-like, AAA ATPase [Septoria linicola]USW54072.1 Putative AAA+ ATPase domain, origin recognition complex subunit 4, orc1-like, AAA ATPase [Septoria linicola]
MPPRPAKRQKVDDKSAKSSTAPTAASSAKAPKAPVTYGRTTKSSPATARTTADAKSEWLAAKAQARQAKTQPRKKRDDDLSVYDDFEGAHRVESPFAVGQRGVGSASKSLDPLRNQRTVEESPKKAGASLGFFKKFGKSKDVAESTKPAMEERQDAATDTHGRAYKGWITATGPPKKTFEDEMREIQEKAKQQMQDEGSEDELAQQSGSKRASGRRTGQRAVSASTVVQTSTKAQPLDRRKKQREEEEEEVEIPESEEEDRMNVDGPEVASEDEMEIEVSMERRPAPPKAIPTSRVIGLKKVAAKPTRKAAAIAQISFEDDQLRCIQKIALEKATRKRPISLTNLDDEYAKVATVIGQTITAGESNSMLVIGAQGSGKTALVDQIIRENNKTNADDFHVVRLSGFIHTDDKIALREIWRQLGREMELDDDEATSKNYADTMTRLLALLSHPAENGIETEQVTKSVIFVLDEFELFAGHPRQTLLYNLFDIAQSRKAPIAVLGLTTRIDVVESLEKRVKSRFSHRYVHLGLPKSLTAFEQICRRAVAVSPEDLSEEEKDILGADSGAVTNWNATIDQLFASDACRTFLQRLFYTTKSTPEFLATLTLALATLPTISQTTTSILEHLTNTFPHSTIIQPPDSKLTLLHGLSTLQLALLVCAARLTNVFNTEVVSFALVYEEYKVLASKAKLQASASGGIAHARVWGKNVARNAWEELVEIKLVLEDGRSVGSRGTGRVDVALEELGGCGVDLGGWGKWCKEI